MAVRMTGMISGMDTESLIKGMMDAQKLKNKRTTDKKDLLTFKQDKWKELNVKLMKLYTDDLSKLRLEGNYGTKKVTSNNDALVEVKGNATSPIGSNQITINQLATSQSVIGVQLKEKINTSTFLQTLGFGASDGKDTIINFTNNGKETSLIVTEKTTLNDFLNASKSVGLNANYDAEQGRIFISAKNSGKVKNFSITTGEVNENVAKSLDKIKGYVASSATDAVTSALDVLKRVSNEEKGKIDGYWSTIVDGEKPTGTPEETKVISALKTIYDAAMSKMNTDLNNEAVLSDLVEQVKGYVNASVDKSNGNHLTALGLGEITGIEGDVNTGKEVKKDESTGKEVKVDVDNSKMTITGAKDAEMTFDGVTIESTSNVFSVNGLTITAKGITKPGETINLNVTNDTQATYDMVKKFVTNYNAILKEMNSLFYADSSKGYDPLSDEERETMSDSQVEKWESKIKDSILRRDTGLGSLLTTMKTSLSGSIEVGEKSYSLSSFGIQTSSDYTERGLLHIFGDKDDPTYADKEDKLMKALEEDPDTVIKTLSSITKNLYDGMADKMKAIPNVRSTMTFYNDKLMDKTQTDYKKKISVMETKLTAMENKYYKQFAAMETALAKMQSQSNALAGMLGTSQQ